MLCGAGSKIDFAGFAGLSPLMVASATNSVAAVKVLWLSYGDNPWKTTNKIVPPETWRDVQSKSVV